MTRAEAAWSFAEALYFNGFQQAYDRQASLRTSSGDDRRRSASRRAWP